MGKMLRAVLGSAGLVNSGGSKKNVATRGYACCPRCKRQQATWRVLLALARQCCFPQPHFTKWSGWSTCRPQPKMQRKNVEKRSRIQRVRKGKGKKNAKASLAVTPYCHQHAAAAKFHTSANNAFSLRFLYLWKKKKETTSQSGTPPRKIVKRREKRSVHAWSRLKYTKQQGCASFYFAAAALPHPQSWLQKKVKGMNKNILWKLGGNMW